MRKTGIFPSYAFIIFAILILRNFGHRDFTSVYLIGEHYDVMNEGLAPINTGDCLMEDRNIVLLVAGFLFSLYAGILLLAAMCHEMLHGIASECLRP